MIQLSLKYNSKLIRLKNNVRSFNSTIKSSLNQRFNHPLDIAKFSPINRSPVDHGKVLNWHSFVKELDPVTGNGLLLVQRSNPSLPSIKAVIPDIHGGLDIVRKYLKAGKVLDSHGNIAAGSRVVFLGDIIGTRIPKIEHKSFTDKSSVKIMRKAIHNDIKSLNWVLKQVDLGRAKLLAGNYEVGLLTNIHHYVNHPILITGVPYVKGYKQYVMGNFEKFGKIIDEKPIITLYNKVREAILSGKMVASHYEDGIFYSHSYVSPRFAQLLMQKGELKSIVPQDICNLLNKELKNATINYDFSHPMFKPSHFDYSKPIQYNLINNHSTHHEQPTETKFLNFNKTTFKIPPLIDFGGPINASPEELNLKASWNRLEDVKDLPKLDFIQAMGHKYTSSFLQHLDLYINPLKNSRITKYEDPHIKLIGLDVGNGYPGKFFPANYTTGHANILVDGRGKGILFIESAPQLSPEKVL